ncbi:hypothetical protein SD70_02590 [Gordoniibacillus kamchatkensis]|uniref:Bacteriophage SP-beta YorD domain-containing protein n=1 Tax=Gordoniibacillus kamchatkensis TaxID=1590651 RepID=A0ABR5AM64_9BACL|nr:XkdW family protein [Paenibacillus sp. VKM B-2647]KIL42091.1 hypothetical protein SD70_02590 [Paenibacillus sp. VKM B-2647]
MDIVKAIQYLHPNSVPLRDFMVQDDSDGNGPYIAQWNVKDADGNDVPQPTDEELQAAWESMQPSEADLLAAAQAAKKAEVSAAVAAKITAGYRSTVVLASTGKAHFYGTDLVDQQNMTASRVWADNHPTEIVKYRPQDELARIDHTHDEFVQISTAVFDRINWYLDQGYAYYRQIYAPVATVDSVNAIQVVINDP